MKRLMNYLLGVVRVRVTGPFPERLLNLCAQGGVPFWGVEWMDGHTLRLTARRRALGLTLGLVGFEGACSMGLAALLTLLERAVSDSLARRAVGSADFVTIQRDEGGAITALTTDTAALNRLRAELTGEILQALEGVDVSAISVPLGSLLDFEPVWARGPSIKARALSVGTVTAEFESAFTSAGVNQTLHRIWLDISVPVTVLLPGERIEVPVHTRLCAAETVIVGEVPQAYLQLDSSAAG